MKTFATMRSALVAGAATLALATSALAAAPDAAKVDLQWDGRIPLRDGVQLSATVYTPKNQAELNANDLDLGSSAPALVPPSASRLSRTHRPITASTPRLRAIRRVPRSAP